MSGKEKFVRNVVCNGVIALVVLSVLVVGFAYGFSNVAASGTPIYKGESDDKVSLMVNVYWGTEYLDPMLDIMEEYGVVTTFFVGGSWVKDNEEMLKKISEKGHEIGNHGYFHKDHKKINRDRNREEIEVTHKLVKQILGIDMNLFAPPSGSFGDTTISVAEELGYKTIMWSDDTIDWRDKDRNLIYTRATKKVKGGSLVLMHPTAATVEALPDILKTLREKGLTVTKVSEVIASIT